MTERSPPPPKKTNPDTHDEPLKKKPPRLILFNLPTSEIVETKDRNEQETLVHAPKLWAEEISKRALLFP